MVELRGQMMSVDDAAKLVGVSAACMRMRVRQGRPLDMPLQRGGRPRGRRSICAYCRLDHQTKLCTLAAQDLAGAARAGLLEEVTSLAPLAIL